MKPTPKNKWVSLYYRSCEAIDRHPSGPHAGDDYYEVTCWPAADIGTTMPDIAEELMILTYSVGWYNQDRRAITYGDAFTFKGVAYYFVDPTVCSDKDLLCIVHDFRFMGVSARAP